MEAWSIFVQKLAGIREGAGAITDFLENFGTLEFTFGLVELALYSGLDEGLLVY